MAWLTPKAGTDHSQQVVVGEGLGQIVVCPQIHTGAHFGFVGLGGQKDERQGFGRFLTTPGVLARRSRPSMGIQ